MRPRQAALITADVDSKELASVELSRFGFPRKSGEWLDTGDTVQGSIFLTDIPTGFGEFSQAVASSIFIWHIAPVLVETDLLGNESDIETIVSVVSSLELAPDRSFSVQTRVLGTGKLPYRKVVLNEAVSNAIELRSGLSMDCRRPQQVVSVLCTPTKAYVGVSLVGENRSAWSGGQHRLKASEQQISRSEFKLEEALNVFDIVLPKSGNALDLGAAPGGWTRLMAEHGLNVTAVDPAELDPRLTGNPRVSHARKRVQDYLHSGRKQFDVIVNDMKMDARESVKLMLHFADRLAPDGIGLVTLKLPKMAQSGAEAVKMLDMLRIDFELLETRFEIIAARQLYFNRSEITVVFRVPLASRQF